MSEKFVPYRPSSFDVEEAKEIIEESKIKGVSSRFKQTTYIDTETLTAKKQKELEEGLTPQQIKKRADNKERYQENREAILAKRNERYRKMVEEGGEKLKEHKRKARQTYKRWYSDPLNKQHNKEVTKKRLENPEVKEYNRVRGKLSWHTNEEKREYAREYQKKKGYNRVFFINDDGEKEYYRLSIRYIYKLKSLYHSYGLSREEFKKIWKKSNGCCYCCGQQLRIWKDFKSLRDEKTEPLHIDHDHALEKEYGEKKNTVRGMLCPSCNISLGHIEEKSKVPFENFINYLEKNLATPLA